MTKQHRHSIQHQKGRHQLPGTFARRHHVHTTVANQSREFAFRNHQTCLLATPWSRVKRLLRDKITRRREVGNRRLQPSATLTLERWECEGSGVTGRRTPIEITSSQETLDNTWRANASTGKKTDRETQLFERTWCCEHTSRTTTDPFWAHEQCQITQNHYLHGRVVRLIDWVDRESPTPSCPRLATTRPLYCEHQSLDAAKNLASRLLTDAGIPKSDNDQILK